MPRITFALATMLSFMAFTPVAAQDLMKGMGAYDAKDYLTALQEWRPLAEQGDADAQYFLGVMYKNGNGVLQDYSESAKWYRLAADQGDVEAQNNLAVMYEEGNGVLQNNIMAHMWYNLAAANGHEKAGEWRDKRAGLMTNADASKAQAMARGCMSGGYTRCGN